jgi:Zn finger protein HypA/HybF involved in hydrogenase expression/pimeloyl-ACP methyl ester carboxylesterase
MFVDESHPNGLRDSRTRQLTEAIDQILSSSAQGARVDPEQVAEAIDVDKQLVVTALEEYCGSSVVRELKLIRCPQCSETFDASDATVVCPKCGCSFSPGDGNFKVAFELVRPPQPKVVIGLHGIRTSAEWHRTLAEVAQNHNWKCRTDRWCFGRFSLLRFLLPWQRNTRVKWFRRTYSDERDDSQAGFDYSKESYPSIVAHSFGTYILGNALLKYDNIRFNKVILCGSILPRVFPWDKILERGQIQEVRNEYGTNDFWSKRVRYFVAATGPSGVQGFKCTDPRLHQEEYSFDHSEYFEKSHINDKWFPFLNERKDFVSHRALEVPQLSSRAPALYWAVLMLIIALVGGGSWCWLRSPTPESVDISFIQFMDDFEQVRDTPALSAFQQEYVEKQVRWEVIVRSITPHDEQPYWTVVTKPNDREFVMALFSESEFRESARIGSRWELQGTVGAGTSKSGVILEGCKVVRRLDER